MLYQFINFFWLAVVIVNVIGVYLKQMLEGSVKQIAIDFDVENIAKIAKASKETKIAEVGVDIEVLTKQS